MKVINLKCSYSMIIKDLYYLICIRMRNLRHSKSTNYMIAVFMSRRII